MKKRILILSVAAVFSAAIAAGVLLMIGKGREDQLQEEASSDSTSLHIESESSTSSKPESSEENSTHLGLDGETHLGLDSQNGDLTDNPPPGDTNTQQGVAVGTEGVPVTGISLSMDSLSIEYDEFAFVPYQVLPGSAGNKAVTFSSSDGSVAKVNDAGLIQPKASGSCVITVTSQENSGITAALNLTVTTPPKNDQNRPEPDPFPCDPVD